MELTDPKPLGFNPERLARFDRFLAEHYIESGKLSVDSSAYPVRRQLKTLIYSALMESRAKLRPGTTDGSAS